MALYIKEQSKFSSSKVMFLYGMLIRVSREIIVFWWYRVVSPSTPRMATTDTLNTQPKSSKRAMYMQRFYHVMRAGGLIAARRREKRRDKPLINLNRYYQEIR